MARNPSFRSPVQRKRPLVARNQRSCIVVRVQRYSNARFLPFLVNLILCVSLLWMQTTAEEILFRCPLLRAAGGDKIAPTARVAVAGVFSCLLFMLVHFQNPKVGSQVDALLIAMIFSQYLIAAAGMYIADVVYGNCLASCAIHWANNFISIALVCQAGTAIQSGSIIWVSGVISAPSSLVSTICLFLPVVAVMIADMRKRKSER